MVRYLIPLGIFAMLVVVLAIGLQHDPRRVPSPLIGKPAPQFSLPELADPARTLSRKDLLGKVTLVNVWASWCVSCRDEARVLVALANSHVVPIYGLNYKDNRDDAQRWLQTFGDPYVANAFDHKGMVAINWGVYGVPETFVVDAKGIIRYKQIGPITQEALKRKILPLVRKLQAEVPG
ncbi:MAG: thiol:disulfide interchange protein [Chromatiales bacterium 21-64-14]|nr:MAG: thiol:disulfide interchange protein [Chromatiales bacterium 21-64-14]HQU14615.1 DsbE family thiol:disulfide interchange protein [Gammaproteobacteria bacterium]